MVYSPRIVFLFLVCLSSVWFTQSNNYDLLRGRLKSELYWRQRDLMDRDQYYTFLESYLKEAEGVLRVVQHCKQNPDVSPSEQYSYYSDDYQCVYFNSPSREHYFICLINYLAASFRNYYIRPNKFVPSMLTSRRADLLRSITGIQETELKDLDVTQELNNTIALLHRANAAYYKKLGLKSKLSLWIGALVVDMIHG